MRKGSLGSWSPLGDAESFCCSDGARWPVLRIGWGAWRRLRRPAQSPSRLHRCWWTRLWRRRSWGTASGPTSQLGYRSCGISWPQSVTEMVGQRWREGVKQITEKLLVVWPHVSALQEKLPRITMVQQQAEFVPETAAVLLYFYFVLYYFILYSFSKYNLPLDLVSLFLGTFP